ncbi:MAG TPA: FAD-binding dehydrogenase [Candidatus Latescibacteria bacterium]|nr:FAD-binding dehydrogenase [Candidatus Latescibacterota bacterium]
MRIHLYVGFKEGYPLPASPPDTPLRVSLNVLYDVIVIGAGGSGLAAAVSASQNGATVLLLEKQGQLGGSTGIAVGSFTANRTRPQADASIWDSLDDHVEDARKFAPSNIESRNVNSLRRFFLSHTADSLHWLMDMGVRFQGPNPEPPNRVPRMHNVVPGAKAYIAALQARLLKYGGIILCEAHVTSLDSHDGSVSGVTANVSGTLKTFRARKGVILAAGDYANSPELIARFKGHKFSSVEGINVNATGDGHLLAEEAGAQLVNMDVTYGPELRFIPSAGKTFQQLLPSRGPVAALVGKLLPIVPAFILSMAIRRLLVTWQHPEDALFEDGAILVNRNGQRFCDETASPEREIAVATQPEKSCYILLDDRLIQRYSQWPHFISTAPRIAYAYVRDYLKLRPDIAVSGSLAHIASSRGLLESELRRTVEETNSQSSRHDLTVDNWALLGPAKAYFTTTEGGAAITEQFQVLDQSDNPIPGLYAVGQNGIGGQILWGHGLHIAWAITSGRLAGKFVASQRALD